MDSRKNAQQAIHLATHVRSASKVWLRALFIAWLVAATFSAFSIVCSILWGGAWVFIQVWAQGITSALLGGWLCAFSYWVLARSDLFEHRMFPSMVGYVVVQIIGTVVIAIPVLITLIDPTAGGGILDTLVALAGVRSLAITIANYFLISLALGGAFQATFPSK